MSFHYDHRHGVPSPHALAADEYPVMKNFDHPSNKKLSEDLDIEERIGAVVDVCEPPTPEQLRNHLLGWGFGEYTIFKTFQKMGIA